MRKYVLPTLTAADWNNTAIIPGDPVTAVRELNWSPSPSAATA